MSPEGPARIEVRLLGPHRAICDGREVRIGSARQRAVLAALALSMNRVLSLDAVVALLWDDDPPRSAKNTVHSLVSRLRVDLRGHTGERACPVRTSGAGYRLDGDPADVDALAFLDAAQRGRRELAAGDRAAADTLRAALDLWTGPALSDLREYQFARLEADRLGEARASATEELAEAELARDRPRDALALADELIAAHPLRERAWAARSLALYRLGRQADALAAHRALRRTLREELGADPTPELRELELALIRQDPALRVAVAPAVLDLPLPPELTTDAGPFVGRESDLRRVTEFLGGRDRAGLVWLLGEPGIGKTRLATELAHRAHRRGAVVPFGRCTEDLAVPYQPFVAALRWFARSVPSEALLARLGALPDELARLVPELDPLAATAATVPGRAEAHRLFEAVRSWLAAAGGPRPVVLVLDDLHWAPPATLALLGYIARSPDSSQLTVLVTARTTAPDDSAALAALAESLERHAVPACRVELAGLGAEQVRELLGHAIGTELDPTQRALAADLHAETNGHPLFVEGVLATLRAGGSWDTTGSPRTLAESVRRRVERLPEPVGEVLRVASLIGLDFELPVLAAACAAGEDEVLTRLEAAAAAGLLEEVAANRYRFGHALLRSALRAGLSRSRAARVHLAIGRALEQVYADDPGAHAVALTHHYHAAESVGGRASAQRFARVAAQQAEGVFAHDDAAIAYARAIELLDPADTGTRVELLLARGQVLKLAGAFAAGLAPIAEAARLAAARGDVETLVRAAAAYGIPSAVLGPIDPVRLDLARLAVAHLPDEPTPLRTLALGALSLALHLAGRADEAETYSDQSLALARHLGNREALGFVLLCRMTTLGRRAERSAEQIALAAEAASVLDTPDRIDEGIFTAVIAAGVGAEAAARLGDLKPWDDHAARLEELAQFRMPLLEHVILMRRQIRATIAGDLDAAEVLLRRAEEIGQGLGWELDGYYALSGILLRREQGRLAALRPALQAVVAARGERGLWAPGLAMVHAELGMTETAQRHFDRVAANGFARVAADDNRPAVLALLADTCAVLGDREHAGRLLEELRPVSGTLVIWTPMGVCLGPVDRLIGNLEAVRGARKQARSHLESALGFSRALPSPLWTAHCLHDLAKLVHPTHPADATALLVEAQDLCRRHGLAGLGASVAALAAQI